MADFIVINKHSTIGDLAMSRKIFAKIADKAVGKVFGAEVALAKKAKVTSPTEVTFKNDGKVMIEVSITLKKDANPEDVCLKIQEEIARELEAYTESVPFEIEISIVDVK